MSFSTTIRDELGELPIKPLCCRRAFLYGLLYGAQTEEDGVTMTFSVYKDAACQPYEQAVHLIRTLFSREAEVTHQTRGAQRYASVSFRFKKAAEHLLALAELPEEEAECETLPRVLEFKCDGCSVHFLRGLFLSCGTVNDPAKSYHLEIKLPDDGRVEPVRILLAEAGYEMGLTNRFGMAGLFCKSGGTIQEMLAYIGATSTVFEFFNAQIERSIRNDENRATNCVTENISRAIRTGARQFAAIEYLEEHNLIAALPEELQFTARLRLNNPDITLAELAELHFPPITKSGLHHRLEKILAFYEKNLKVPPEGGKN
ncbi:MAG: DNA-binding protein WhiA [Clostridia bacterium]|nr:DNA-binding protein WhiA [Clostridia bacterium]